jgi:hypothetical protein
MPELIKVSCKMADAAGYPAFPGCEVTPYSELLDEVPEHERRQFHKDVDSLAAAIGVRIQAVESM